MGKPVFVGSNKVQHKLGCTTTEDDNKWLEMFVLSIAKTKALISYAVTTQLICAFVLAYARNRFSHYEVHMINYNYMHI